MASDRKRRWYYQNMGSSVRDRTLILLTKFDPPPLLPEIHIYIEHTIIPLLAGLFLPLVLPSPDIDLDFVFPVNDVCVHPNQGELISCDQAGSIKQWDLSENICSHELVGCSRCSACFIHSSLYRLRRVIFQCDR